jgi:ATP-dependent helicase Lhr and Lhr-like helicase
VKGEGVKSVLSFFHPLIRQWFSEKVGKPTEVQEKAWPEIVKGGHVLVTAPTGCGKTLAAFLWGLNQLVIGAWPKGKVRVLYISPLKALNNDVQRNLLKPLGELKEAFSRSGASFPEISVLTRSGDTPGEERRKMFRRPPEVLITTPESLNLLLTSRSGRSMLDGIATVILDEIHAVAGSKRGTHLITAVERLVPLSGEFQRIALSATINPPERVAEFVGGFRRTGAGKDGFYEKRPVSLIQSRQAKSYEIRVSFPPDAREKMADDSWWPALIDSFREIIDRHASTLFFANSRRTTEKVVRMINETSEGELAYAHHGSLSREIRLAVEQKMKRGELKAIVATNSLELGIDIGGLDQVVLIQTPRAVSSALQRVGRSGHDVGETSKGAIYPTHGRDFVDAAVMARALLDQDIEEIRPIDSPLDVLAQVVLSMTAMERWDIDELFAFLKTMYPFRDLPRRLFDIVLEMLGGRYADTRLRELKARVSIDRIDNTVQAHSEVPYLIYTSGGTIPERGYFDLRLKDTRAKIGELDEEFVWERSIGETFTLGSQLWRIEKITQKDVEVVPARSATGIFPFWKAEELNRDFHLSERIGLFLERADVRLDKQDFKQELMTSHVMDETAADELISFLKLQKEATGQGLPNRHRILIEYIEEPVSRGELKQAILHTFWGGRVNRPFALALSQAWEEHEHTPLQVIEADDALFLMLPREVEPRDILGLLSSGNVEAFLRKKLEQTGFFGARFRENAERALLLPKSNFKRRMPLWLIRLRAKELLEAVRRYEDFPVLIETWRTCLEDEFDLENLKTVLDELRDGRISVGETVTRAASPFASHLVWKQTNKYMYEDDTPLMAKESALRPELIKELLFSSHLRPKIPSEVIAVLDEKLKRTSPGYAPGSALELLDWVKERMLIPETEWKGLAAAIRKDAEAEASEWLRSNGKKLLWLTWPGVKYPLLTSIESMPKILVAFRLLLEDISIKPVSTEETGAGLTRRIKSYLREHEGASVAEEYDLSAFLASWLAYYGPINKESVHELLGITSERLDEAIEPLIEAQDLVMDRFGEESTMLELCDSENLEMLLRMARRYRRPSFQALPPEKLALFLAAFQGITPRGESIDDLQERLEQLFGWPAPVGAWEEYILPARMENYRSEWIDSLMSQSELIWFGCGERKIGLAFSQDLELFHPSRGKGPSGDGDELTHLIPDRRGRYGFLEIAEYAHLDTARATELLWKEAWKGNVTCDSFRTLRKGVMAGFTARAFGNEAHSASRRSGFNRWKVSRPLEGNWLRIDTPPGEEDLLEEEELVKDRIRQLLKRYGVLFRELLSNELLPLQWRAVFRSLRLMELSGEVLSGYFFEHVPGPQFLSHDAFRLLREPPEENVVFWINATDPASLCGLGLEAPAGLPPRVPSTYLVYHGSRLVLIAKRGGKGLDILVPPGDPRLAEYFVLFKDLLAREFNPVRKVVIEAINGEPAAGSPYAEALRRFGFRSARSGLELWKEYS